MFAMKLLFLLLLASVTFGQSIEEKVKKFEDAKSYTATYDKFQKMTKVQTSIKIPSSKGSEQMLVWLYLYEGGNHIRAFVFSKSRGYYNRPFLRFLADDAVIEIQSRDIDSIATFQIPESDWDKLANAKKVEVQLLEFEGVLDAKGITKLRNLASLTKSQPPAPALK